MEDINEKKVRIAFVVLHYLAIQETRQCIEYIRKNIDIKDYKIIVVDNASGNGSGAVLEQEYKNSEDILVVLNEENLGFSNGNNVGFLYAKEHWKPEFIILMNNDVYLLEKNLYQKLQEEYKETNFAVSGPLIMTRDGKCNINPMRQTPLKREEIAARIKVLNRFLKLEKVHLLSFYIWLSSMLHWILQELHRGEGESQIKEYLVKKENVQLHGCFLVFSKKYTEKFDGLDNRTFLYMEEDILYQHILNNNMKMVYSPDIIVYHKEDAATDLAYGSKKKKNRMQYENELKSCEILLKVYDSYNS